MENKAYQNIQHNFLKKLGFTPCKAEQPLRNMELQEKKVLKDYRIQEICKKRTKSKVSVNSNLKSFRSEVKRKHSIYREFQSLAVRRMKLLTDTLVTSKNGDRKFVLSIGRVGRPTLKIRKWKHLSQLR